MLNMLLINQSAILPIFFSRSSISQALLHASFPVDSAKERL